MILNRNSSCNTSSGCSWLVYLAFLIIAGIILFGARHKIKQEIREFAALDKSEVETIIKDYIENNPKVIINSLQDMQKREYEEMMKQSQAKIHENIDALQGKNNEIVPYAGNKNGDVQIITFLDYRCGYCKRANNDLKELVKKDPNVKIIFKEMPILGPQSMTLARTALAVYVVDESKYLDFHNALMEMQDTSDKSLDQIYIKLKLDKDKVMKAMNDPKIQKEIENVASLAEKVGVRGTPAFIVDEEFIPGAIDLGSLINKINDARVKNKK